MNTATCATTSPVSIRNFGITRLEDRSWLVVTRNTLTHEISKVELARDVARARGRSKMKQSNRLDGGQIDRNTTLNFRFDGRSYTAHPGDTLASALLANDVRLIGRSFKYHRPRGLLTAGSEEPNGIVELRTGARREPNTRATTIEMFEGLEARSQNRWPSLKFDALAVNDLFSNFLSAGFYYKTFMWPAAFWEKLYEPMIRRAAGLGSLSMETDPDEYDKGFRHCDLLIIGAGPAGLMAALTAGRAGADVILADEDFTLGGRLNSETFTLGDNSASDWAAQSVAELSSMPNVRLMPRTTVIGAFDHGIYGAVERTGDHLASLPAGKPRQILWRIYTTKALLCAGATERPIAFENNDRPGVMMASALRTYANRFAVTASPRVAIFTNNDDGHRTASDLHAKGVKIAAVVDVREDAPTNYDYEVLKGGQVVDHQRPSWVDLCRGCDARWLNPHAGLRCVGCVRGMESERPPDMPPARTPGLERSDCSVCPGRRTAWRHVCRRRREWCHVDPWRLAVRHRRRGPRRWDLAGALPDLPAAEDAPIAQTPFWYVQGCKRAWVDQQNDVTVKDVKLSYQEGFRSVEHLKRYTTLGMATDQGKTSNITGLAIMAEVSGKSIPETGTTIFRPPYTPVPIATFAGRMKGQEFHPTRLTPSHYWAKERGAVFVEVGNWLRAQWFPLPGETHWREIGGP